MEQRRVRLPAGQGQVAGAVDVHLECSVNLVLAVIDAMKGGGVDDDIGVVGAHGEVYLRPAFHVKLAVVEGGELLVDEDPGEVGRELTASAGQEYAQRPASSAKGMRIRDGGPAGELFCKRYVSRSPSTPWMRVGICFAILGVPVGCGYYRIFVLAYMIPDRIVTT